jgi:predicted phage terminase large subunit-like protein
MNALTPEQVKQLHALPVRECIEYWDALETEGRKQGKLSQVIRMLVLADLYYLLVRVCKREDMLPRIGVDGFVDNQFAFDRCRDVQANPDGHVDLWSREHFKSSVVTFGKTIQDILSNPEITFGIFSHTRPIAKAFLRQIMRELEENRTLQAAFPDVLWSDVRQSPKWGEDDGIIVKRKSNPKEATIEAWGLIDGQPTSKHYQVLLYDDVVVRDSITTPEMIEKTMVSLEQSYNLGVTPGGTRRMAGTRWHFSDAYRTVVDRGSFKPREHPGRKGGTEDGESVLWSDQTHLDKRRDMGPYTYASQVLLNPKADALQGFRREWLRHFKKLKPASMNWYLLFDGASSKKKGSDYTAGWAVGLGLDGNYYCIPEVRDRLNLKERGDRLFDLHRKYKPKQVRYEKYGLMSDIEHYQARMENENYRFQITEVAGQTSKQDRIKRLVPLFEAGRIWLPESHYVTDWQKTTHNLVHDFIEEEFYPFPVGLHDDMLDSLARIAEPDLKLVWPKEAKPEKEPEPLNFHETSVAWMA